MNKNIILIPNNTDLNRGDEALVWESIELIKDVYGSDVHISIIGPTDESEESRLQTRQTKELGYEILESPLRHPGRFSDNAEIQYSRKTLFKWGWVALKDLFFSGLLLSKISFFFNYAYKHLDKQQQHTYREIERADAIYVKGGGFIHSYGGVTDAYKIYYLLYLIILSQKFGKDVFILPNSIGPLKNPIAYYLTKRVLKKCKLVTTRESISYDFVKSIGLDVHKFPDLGFYLKPSEADFTGYLSKCGVDFSKENVLLTLRPYRFEGAKNPTELYENYEKSVLNTIDFLISEGYGVTLFAHTLGPSAHEDDRNALKGVMAKLPNNLKDKIIYISDDNLTCRDVEKIYSYYDYLIGTRFHSVIFSLNVNVPAIAIAYGGNKGKGIMEDLKNDEYSVNMDNLNDNSLIEKMQKLVAYRDSYLENLKKSRLEIEKKREDLILLIKK